MEAALFLWPNPDQHLDQAGPIEVVTFCKRGKCKPASGSRCSNIHSLARRAWIGSVEPVMFATNRTNLHKSFSLTLVLIRAIRG